MKTKDFSDQEMFNTIESVLEEQRKTINELKELSKQWEEYIKILKQRRKELGE